MMVPILKQGDVLIATIMAALSDEDMRQFREALLDRVVTSRASAVIIDVMAMDVLDSFATRTLREIAWSTEPKLVMSSRVPYTRSGPALIRMKPSLCCGVLL